MANQLILASQHVRASGLVDAVFQVGGLADFVVTQVALRVVDVPQLEVLGDPKVLVVENTVRDETHGRGGREGHVARGSLDEGGAPAGINRLVLGGESSGGIDVVLLRSRVARLQIVPVLKADVVSTSRVIEVHEQSRATSIRDLYKEVVAADGLRPVGHVVHVGFAT